MVCCAGVVTFEAVTVADLNGTINNFPQNGGASVYVPLFANMVQTIPLHHLQTWPAGAPLPDPKTIYITS